MAEFDLDETLISREAARFLGISPQKLIRLRQRGVIDGKKLGNGANLYAYRLADLRKIDPKLLERQKTGPKPKKDDA